MKKFLFLALVAVSNVFQSHASSPSDLLVRWRTINYRLNDKKQGYTQAQLDKAKNAVKNAINAKTFNDATIQDPFTNETALFIAAHFNDLPMAQFLLEGTTNSAFKQSAQQSINTTLPNSVLDNGNQPNWTALNWAVNWNNPDMMTLLKKYGAIVAKDKLLAIWQSINYGLNNKQQGYTQAMVDAAKNDVKNAINGGTFNDATIKDNMTSETALIIAARFNDLPMAQFLLEGTTNSAFKQSAQQSINTTSPKGVHDNGNQPNWTALNWAQKWNNSDMIALLKKYGAN